MDEEEKTLQLYSTKCTPLWFYKQHFLNKFYVQGEKSSEISRGEIKQSVSRFILTQPSTSVANNSIIIYFL